jgi:hypothetical protein
MKEKYDFEDPFKGARVMLKWILIKWDVMNWLNLAKDMDK